MAKQPPSPSNAETSSYTARESDSTAGLLSRLLGTSPRFYAKSLRSRKRKFPKLLRRPKRAPSVSQRAAHCCLRRL